MKRLLCLVAFLPLAAFATPQDVKISDALAMREAITSILKGHVVVTAGASGQQPIVTMEPFDLATGALLALGHDKNALNRALDEFDSQKTDVQAANKITGRSDDSHDAVSRANEQLGAYIKAHPTVSVDLEPISLDDLQIAKNKLDNDAVFGVLGPILKTK